MFLSKITLPWSALTVDKLLVSPQVRTVRCVRSPSGSAGRWPNTTDSANTDQSDGTKRNGDGTETWRVVWIGLRQQPGHQDRPNVVYFKHKSTADVRCLMQGRCSESITVTNHSDSAPDWQLMNCTLTSGSDKRFFLRRCPNNSPAHQTIYSMGTRRSLLEVKAVGAWIWPVTPI